MNDFSRDPIDLFIEAYIVEHQDTKLTVKSLQSRFRVHPERIKSAARRALRVIHIGNTISFNDELWGNARHLMERYGLDYPNRRALIMKTKRKGKVIRSLRIRTHRFPLTGETFYNIGDIDRFSIRISKTGRLADRRESEMNPTISRKPYDLSERDYEALLLLIESRIKSSRLPSLPDLAEAVGLSRNSAETFRKRTARLEERGYIQFRPAQASESNDLGGRRGFCRPFEYRYLRGPAVLLAKLQQIDSQLVRPFEDQDSA